MLMSAHNGGVEHHVFTVVIAGQQLKNALENAAFCPSTKSLMHYSPITKARRQITPRDACPVSVKNGFDKQSVVCRGTTDMSFTPGQKILDLIPLIVSQSKALHGSALRKADCP